jgi:small subunit ribosomal protein S4
MLVFTSPNRARGVLTRLKHHYGPREPELARYAQEARRGADAVAVLLLCERRLENVLRRAGFTRSRLDARRAVVHGHIFVNGRKMTHPGYLVQAGDEFSVRPRPHIQGLYRSALATSVPPSWVQVDAARLRATVIRLPAAGDVAMSVDATGVVEELLSHSSAEAES